MIRIYLPVIYQLIRVLLVSGHDSSVTLSVSSESSVFKAGDNVTITCSLDYTRTGGDTLLWYRSQGLVKEMMCSKMNRAREFPNERYVFEHIDNSDKSASYKLNIKSLRLEDSATIECSSLSLKKATWPLIVCVDPQSDSCRCMIEKGWPSPDCFKTFLHTRSQHTGFRNAVIVLSVLLFALIVVSVILTYYVVRDCVTRVRYWRDKTEASEPLTPAVNAPPVDHVPVPASALRNRKAGGEITVVPGSAVRFEESLPNDKNKNWYAGDAVPQNSGPPEVVMSPQYLHAPPFVAPGSYPNPTGVPYDVNPNLSSYPNQPHYSPSQPQYPNNQFPYPNDQLPYLSGVNYNMIGNMPTYTNQPENPTYYNSQPNNQSGILLVQRNPSVNMQQYPTYEMVNPTQGVFQPNYGQAFGDYSDQTIANNLNESRAASEVHRSNHSLHTSAVNLHNVSATHLNHSFTGQADLGAGVSLGAVGGAALGSMAYIGPGDTTV